MVRQILASVLCVGVCASTAYSGDLDQWLRGQAVYSKAAMLRNIGPSASVPEAVPGSVVASPSYEPFYRYHWIRDAALTMDVVVGLYERASDPAEKSRLAELLSNYVSFSRRNQLTPNPSGGADELGLGEPKFNLDGSAFTGPWGRPQNDGPALRATTLAHLARLLMRDGRVEWVRTNLYTVIKPDLEFVSHHWRDASYDLWEEVKGDHFYTRMVQRRALVDGADLASRLGDTGAAGWYRAQARLLEPEIERHWDAARGYLTVTLNRVGGLDYKSSGLDVAVVLGALHGSPRDGTTDPFFGVTDERVLATATKVSESFRRVFPINGHERDWDGQAMAPGIGRYPEDHYSGGSAQLGNPWFLATNAFAELYARCAHVWETEKRIRITKATATLFGRVSSLRGVKLTIGEVVEAGDQRFAALLGGVRELSDSYLRRSRYHADSSGALSEQFNRDSGYMTSAAELTWSHASVLTSTWARSDRAN